MKKTKAINCSSCQKYPLSRDEIGASEKFLGTDTEQFFCIACLAAYLEATPEDIEEKIQMFKEDGCTLFK